jgi:hypothetical protein
MDRVSKKLLKQQVRAEAAELRAILCDWDPIGVMDDPEWPRDEYDCMLGPLMRLLKEEAEVGRIADYLQAEITGHFGLSGGCYSFVDIAGRLKAWSAERGSPDNRALNPTGRRPAG